MNKCEFSISCPNCHKNPPLILSIQSSLLLNKSNIKSKCSCSKYEILSQDLKDFYIECTLDKKESPSTLKWEQSLSKGQIVSKDAIIESIQNEQNYLNIIYEKLIKKIEAFEDVITKIKNQVNKLFKWDEGYISKNTVYTNPMENYVNFNNKSDPVIQRFLKIYPELDYSFKLTNKIYFENITSINSLEYYILKKPKSQNQIEAENNNPLSVLKNPVLIPKFGYKFSFDKYQTKFNYSKSFKRSKNNESTIECIAELNNGNMNINNYQTNQILEEHEASVLKLYQLKNSKFVSCSVDGTLRIWDPFQSYSSSVLRGHKDAVESCVELEAGVIASCSLDEHIRIWDTYMGKCKMKIRVRKTLIDIDYYITGDLLVISGDKRLMIINYELGNIINEYVNNNEIYCLCHSSDGKIFLGCNKGEVKILNKKFQNITTLKIHDDVVSSMKLFKNQMLATCSWDGSFAISI